MQTQLDIVLLGGPGAGKTSLVGALVQAAQSQTAVLHGKLAGTTKELTGLKEATYEKGPAPTRGEVEQVSLTLDPPGAGAAVRATFTDCSGAAAEKLLASRTPLEAGSALAQAVAAADAVLLVVDAAAGPAALERDFQQLGQFLRRLQESRGRRVDVAGLPVYLVLSKCDLLARPSHTHAEWMQRIEEAKRDVGLRFRDFAKQQKSIPFGGIDLHLWAAAIKRPALADKPAKPEEPYGVAELFRQAFAAAGRFAEARDQASSRLSLAALGVFGLLAALGVIAAVFFALRPSVDLIDLENRVQSALSGSTTADRLREPLDERLAELKQVQKHALFEQLPEKTRQDVVAAAAEIEAYQQANRKLLASGADPRFATREEELEEIAKKLDAFRLPAEYAEAWSDTKLAKRLGVWQFDVAKLREAVAEEEKWIRQQIAEGEALRKQGGLVIAKTLPAAERDAWFVKVKDYLEREPRHKRSERVAPGASATYDTVYKFQRVEAARKEWDRMKGSLKNVRAEAQ